MNFSDRNHFYKVLNELEQQFGQLKPELELAVTDRESEMEGYVVVYNTLKKNSGPLGRCGKGGTRITPTLSLDEVRMLAKTMALKNAAAGLPLGGAKSGVKADPDGANFERTYRAFVREVKPILKENGGIFGGFGFDVGARPIHPIWACDELKSTRSFTGKPIHMGGTDYDKEGIAGLGVAVAAKSLLESEGKKLSTVTSAIQGLGAMGAAVFRYFSEYGGQVLFVSDVRLNGTFDLSQGVSAALHNAIVAGDFAAMKQQLEEGRFPKHPLDAVLYANVDLLFPCAIQDVIGTENAGKIAAKYIVEGANNPCSEEARTVLFERGVTIIPDFIANPGGIIAAYVELSSDVTPEENVRTRKKVEQAKTLTRERIAANIERLVPITKEFKVQPVHVGRYMALKNILEL